MKKKILFRAVLLVCVAVSVSCTSFKTIERPKPDKPSVEPIASPVEEPKKEGLSKPIVGASVLELLEVAKKQAAAGKGEQAAETLERAIKIEPNNPWLWHRLAVLRMQQKKWSQSVELANKSIALAKGNKRLIGGNWLVISLALEGAGNHVAAGKAKKNSDVYLGKE